MLGIATVFVPARRGSGSESLDMIIKSLFLTQELEGGHSCEDSVWMIVADKSDNLGFHGDCIRNSIASQTIRAVRSDAVSEKALESYTKLVLYCLEGDDFDAITIRLILQPV